MATFKDFDDLVVCDKCRDDINADDKFEVVEGGATSEIYHAECAPAKRSARSIALDAWLPVPL